MTISGVVFVLVQLHSLPPAVVALEDYSGPLFSVITYISILSAVLIFLLKKAWNYWSCFAVKKFNLVYYVMVIHLSKLEYGINNTQIILSTSNHFCRVISE